MRRRIFWISGTALALFAGLFVLDRWLRESPIQETVQIPASTTPLNSSEPSKEPVTAQDVLDIALRRWKEIESYQCTVTSTNLLHSKIHESVLSIKFKRPHQYRHLIVDGHNQGVLLTYNGQTVHARPGGLLRMMVVQIDPGDERLVDGRGRPFYESDWGSELDRCVKVVEEGGTLTRSPDEIINDDPCWVIKSILPGPVDEVCELSISQKSHLVKRVLNTRKGDVLRDAIYSNIALNAAFSDSEFILK